MKKAVHFYRWSLILLCAAISGCMFFYINQSYDPLARYPYVSDYNRDIILEHLNSEEIDYIINQQLKPAQFMPFIDTEGFNIRNTKFYTAAYEAREYNRKDVVAFVNTYREYFTMASMVSLLEHYSYQELTNFIETQLVLDPSLKLVENPSDPYLILDDDWTVFKYQPESLIVYQNLQMQPAIAENLSSLLTGYEKAMDGESSLHAAYGYMSYEEIMEEASRLSGIFNQYTGKLFRPAGKNEAQLGYTITLKEAGEWLSLLEQHRDVLEEKSTESLLLYTDDEMKDKIQWLENNAWKYGFILRYPKGRENETGHYWQPFILRYVGVENARKMRADNAVMETFDFES